MLLKRSAGPEGAAGGNGGPQREERALGQVAESARTSIHEPFWTIFGDGAIFS